MYENLGFLTSWYLIQCYIGTGISISQALLRAMLDTRRKAGLLTLILKCPYLNKAVKLHYIKVWVSLSTLFLLSWHCAPQHLDD